MESQLRKYNKENDLFDEKSKILVAFSGGIDSRVLLHLIVNYGVECAVAHCNFHLRGRSSDKDQDFAREIAGKYNIPFYTIDFDARNSAKEMGVSIQMAARSLRYDWFRKLCSAKGYNRIATGHNMNDNAETILLNFSRGTGIKGLQGIVPRSGDVIRPILFASRDEIEEYAKKEKLKFREDKSNSSLKYKRNKIRHEVIPVLQELNPSFLKTILRNSSIIAQSVSIIENDAREKISAITEVKQDTLKLSIKKLKDSGAPEHILYYFLDDYGFSTYDIFRIAGNLDSSSGKEYYSSTHWLIKDREYLILSEKNKIEQKKHIIEKGMKEINSPFHMKLEYGLHPEPEKSTLSACLDESLINFPLILRKWKPGDYFFPLGMNGKKKLSDFFTDMKFSLLDKKNIWLLECAGEIIWVVGYRIDNRFKISRETKNMLKISIPVVPDR